MSLICRTCMQINKQCVTILGYHNGKLLSDMLVEFARIKVRENDGLPLYICNGCLEKLTSAWDFRVMIIEADLKLHGFFNNHIKKNVVHSNNSHIDMTIVKEEPNIVKSEITASIIPENRCISNSSRPECPLEKIAGANIDIHTSSPNDKTKENSDKILVKKSVNEDDLDKNLCENDEVIPKISIKKSIKKERIMSTHSETDNAVGIPSNLKQSDTTNLSNSSFCSAALTDRNINETNDSNENSTKDKIEKVETKKQTDIIGDTRSENNLIIDEQDNEMLEENCPYSSDDTNNSDTSLRNTMDVELGSDKVTRKLTKEEESKMSVFCKLCNRSFGYRYYFEVHVKHHNGDKKWKCSICGKAFVRQFQLRLHMKVHSDERPFSCEICGKTFKYQGQLHSHKSLHSDDTQYICSICQKSFKAKSLLRAHFQRHDTEKKFTCEVCGRAYNDPSTFSRHKLTHVDGKKFPCPTCGKAFTTNLQMRAHLKLHSETRLYSCNYCGKAFKTKHVMETHILIHTGERPYSCKICDKSFRQTAALYNHMRIHTGETPYTCELCPSQFKYSHHLQNHMKAHK